MGTAFSSLYNFLFGKQEFKILIVGLDNSGKTMILHRLAFDKYAPPTPSIRPHCEKLDYGNISFVICDLGGRQPMGFLRKDYFPNTRGLIYVVDCNDRERIDEAREELMRILKAEELQNLALLVFANKQDRPNAMDATEITEKLELNNIQDRPWHVQRTSMITREGLYEGLHWLFEQLTN